MKREFHRYERLATSLEQQIRAGTFQVGERLPSVRELRRYHGVSTGTVVKALSILESQGLAFARPKSGFYVQALPDASTCLPRAPHVVPEPTAVGVSNAAADLFTEAGDADMINFGAALPSPDFFPNEKLSRMLAAVSREDPEKFGHYDILTADEGLRHQLARRFSLHHGADTPDDLIVTCGATEGINLAVRSVARPGDLIAVETPGYFGSLQILESLHMDVLPVPSSCEDGIHTEALQQALEDYPIKALLLVPSYSNPNGSCLSEARRRSIVELLSNYGVPLIEDDVYGELYHEEKRPPTMKSFDQSGDVIYVNSFSKTLSPGMRVGWVSGGRFTERIRRLKHIHTLMTPTIPQRALARFLQTGMYERHMRRIRRDVRRQTHMLASRVREFFPTGTAVSNPHGGFCLWVEMPPGIDCFAFRERAKEKKISVSPGSLFCANGGFRNFLGMNAALEWNDQVDVAVQTLGTIAGDLARRSLKPALTNSRSA